MESICWTCNKVCTSKCPKYGRRVTVKECSDYEYDGECVVCVRNPNRIHKCLYEICQYHRPEWRGYCAQENWRRMNGY